MPLLNKTPLQVTNKIMCISRVIMIFKLMNGLFDIGLDFDLWSWVMCYKNCQNRGVEFEFEVGNHIVLVVFRFLSVVFTYHFMCVSLTYTLYC